MTRTNRIALLAAAVLLLVAAGSVMAGRAPVGRDIAAPPASSHEPQEAEEAEEAEEADEADDAEQPSAEALAHAGDRLTASDIPFDEAVLADLATRYGVGGAVRTLAWASQATLDVEQITSMRDGTDTEPGMGWGQIARELDLHPGLGSIMGNGHGRENAPGQLKEKQPEG
ncbi:MAG: hypothetical protein M3406_06850 [Chloroflexota bacterium]|nr:hypothetical protein [Chloroflexota bacterium]